MKPGELLTLVRKPENKFDRHAIVLHYGGEKIGFVPKEKNEVLSGLLDSDKALLSAEILKVEDDSNSWEELQVGIYLVGKKAMVA